MPSLARISASGSTYAVRVREDLRGQGLGFTASHEGFKLRL